MKKETIDAYLTSALWTATDNEGEPLDKKYSITDFTPEARELAEKEIQRFFDLSKVELCSPEVTVDDTDVIHDLWLSRNGHGTGFFDKPECYGTMCDRLQTIAKSLLPCYVMETDDGTLDLVTM